MISTEPYSVFHTILLNKEGLLFNGHIVCFSSLLPTDIEIC